MTKAQKIDEAIASGFCFYKDHGEWFVAYVVGASLKVLSGGHKNKSEARGAMIVAWEQSTYIN